MNPRDLPTPTPTTIIQHTHKDSNWLDNLLNWGTGHWVMCQGLCPGSSLFCPQGNKRTFQASPPGIGGGRCAGGPPISVPLFKLIPLPGLLSFYVSACYVFALSFRCCSNASSSRKPSEVSPARPQLSLENSAHFVFCPRTSPGPVGEYFRSPQLSCEQLEA